VLLERTQDMVEIENAVFHAALQALAVGLAGMDMAGARNEHVDLFFGVALGHEMGVIQADHQTRHIFQHALASFERTHRRFAVRLRTELDIILPAIIDHAAHLIARDLIGLLRSLAFIFVGDA
jgi:hypothetical protein